MSEASFVGTNAQLLNALEHMATARPITKAEKAIVREASDQITALTARAEAAEAKLAEAVEALGFYADLPAEWTIDPKGRSSDMRYGDLRLLGEKALATLAKIKGDAE